MKPKIKKQIECMIFFNFTFIFIVFYSISLYIKKIEKFKLKSLDSDKTVDKSLIVRIPNVFNLGKSSFIVDHNINILFIVHVKLQWNKSCF